MLIKPSKATTESLPQVRMLTEAEDLAMKENLARKYFDMSLEEFTAAWKSGEFDGDRERHGAITFLAMMLPEYWAE